MATQLSYPFVEYFNPDGSAEAVGEADWETGSATSGYGVAVIYNDSQNTEYTGTSSKAYQYAKYRKPSSSTSINQTYSLHAKLATVPAGDATSTYPMKYVDNAGELHTTDSGYVLGVNTSTIPSKSAYDARTYQYEVRRGRLPWRSSSYTGEYDDAELDDGNTKSSSHTLYGDATSMNVQNTRTAIIHSCGIYEGTPYSMMVRSIRNYNRYKLPMPDMMLQRSFAHVFFVKPNCNILSNASDGTGKLEIIQNLQYNSEYVYALMRAPYLFYELTSYNPLTDYPNDFSFLLSNAVQSFSLQDESLDTDSYGKSYAGHSIAFGRNSNASRSAGEVTVTFQDDKALHIYQLIKLWTVYIEGCYKGTINPTLENLQNHILDYAGAIYYILTAEDGETILFWSKYYGVFPVNSPSNMFGWSYGNLLSAPKYDITFKYSYKEDYNPTALYEFNTNANLDDYETAGLTWMGNFNYDTLGPGRTWVGTPYIQTTRDVNNLVQYKLKFAPGNKYGDLDYSDANDVVTKSGKLSDAS